MSPPARMGPARVDPASGPSPHESPDPAPSEPLRARLAQRLASVREQTWNLVPPGTDLASTVHPVLSPPWWDLGHIADFQDQWLVQRKGHPPTRPDTVATFDPLRHPRSSRTGLPPMARAELETFLAAVLAASLRELARERLEPGAPATQPASGVLYELMAMHEEQHQETLLQQLFWRTPRADPLQEEHSPAAVPPPHPPRPAPSAPGSAAAWCHVPAGSYPVGRDLTLGSYDNEAPAHLVDLPAFAIARLPATNADYLAFLDAGGYEETRWWSAEGRRWLNGEPHHAPLHWRRKDGGWQRRGATGWQAIRDVPDEILAHVSWFEAQAFAAHAGARLPSETEWEAACRGPEGALNPWGDALAGPARANVGQASWRPGRAGGMPQGASWCGAEHMVGDVWEWTSTDFAGYPGFTAHPYREYSEIFFGSAYKVLRGGSWATQSAIATGTFRNWDFPQRRQIFSGIRLARAVTE